LELKPFSKGFFIEFSTIVRKVPSSEIFRNENREAVKREFAAGLKLSIL